MPLLRWKWKTSPQGTTSISDRWKLERLNILAVAEIIMWALHVFLHGVEKPLYKPLCEMVEQTNPNPTEDAEKKKYVDIEL